MLFKFTYIGFEKDEFFHIGGFMNSVQLIGALALVTSVAVLTVGLYWVANRPD